MMTSARAASRIGGHRNLLFVPSPTTTTTTHHDQCHGEEQCQENTYKLFSSWKKKTTTMRKQTEEMSPSSNCKRLSTLLFRIHSAPYYCFPLGFAHKDWETKWNWNCVTMKGVLRNMRSQLYSAAEYFELSNMNDDGKEMVMRSLKDYAVKAIANAVDHLGSVSYKVDNLLDYEVDEASVATFEVSCIDQRLRTWQTHIDHEGLSQQSLLIKPPKNVHSQSPSPCPSKSEQYLSPSQKMHSIEKISYNAYNPLTGARSAASRPNIPNSSKKVDRSNFILLCYIL
ncbi:hypothetical protein MUK42_14064 [Musa troglodytarum]|uniref:Uncharacterized protein n=1 Tax=Musa troglodytarum TaxID=320322 RepID=A0A9E7KJ27_9LILI|nr:hypothetical protein MUK42_14064 [Musa troglodytarum]